MSDMELDSSGNAYIIGELSDPSDWWRPEDLDGYAGGSDAFVVKLDPAGTPLWTTLLGGSDSDRAMSLAIDESGAVFVSGVTTSSDWSEGSEPLGKLAFQGGTDVFVSKLNASTGEVVWSQLLGGMAHESGIGVCSDGSGGAFLVGQTTSAEWVDIPHVGDSYAGGRDGFIAHVANDGARQWHTFFGGSDSDAFHGIDRDSYGDIVVIGSTYNDDIAFGGFGSTYNGGSHDALVAKFSPISHEWSWAGYLGSNGNDTGYEVVISPENDAIFVTGGLQGSPSDSAVLAAFNNGHGGDTDAYVAKISSTGELRWGMFLGGTGADMGHDLALDASGRIFVTGYTRSDNFLTGFPVTGSDTTLDGAHDAFVAVLSDAGDSGVLEWGRYLGGSGDDFGRGLGVSSTGSVWVIGGGNSADLGEGEITINDNGTDDDCFVVRMSCGLPSIVFAEHGTVSGIDLQHYYSDIETPASEAIFSVVSAFEGVTVSIDPMTHIMTIEGNPGFHGEGYVTIEVVDTGDGESEPLSDSDTFHVRVNRLGDLNGDGVVGSADLDVVRGAWGRVVSAGRLHLGDASGDGMVGSADLDIIRANWGSGASVASVPASAGDSRTGNSGGVYGPVPREEMTRVAAAEAVFGNAEVAKNAWAAAVDWLMLQDQEPVAVPRRNDILTSIFSA